MVFDYFTTLFPILTGVFGIFFLVIGLKGLLTKRPFLISNRWPLVMMFVFFVPMGFLP